MAEKFVFDAAGVEALEAREREWRAWDEALPGFGVRIRPSGTKSWIVRARMRGADGKVRQQRITIGRCGEMSLEEARAQARRLGGAGVGAAAVEALPTGGMEERASRGGDDAAAEDDRVERKSVAAGRDGSGPPGAPDSAAAAGKAAVGGDRPGAGPESDLAKTLDGIRGGVDMIQARGARTEAQLEQLSSAVAVAVADRRRKRWRLVVPVLAGLAGVAAGLAGGVYVQSRDPILPQADPTLGWKDHVWNYYGETFMGCFQRAKATESGYADCTMKVRAR